MATDIAGLKQRLLTRTTPEQRSGLSGAALTQTAQALGASETDVAEALRELQQQSSFTSPVTTAKGLSFVPAASVAVPQGAVWSGAGPDVTAKLAQLKALLAGGVGRNVEGQIIDLFKTATPAELNALFEGETVDQVHDAVDDVEDHKFLGIKFGAQNHTALLKLLTQDRVGDLTTSSRAKLIHGLQFHRTDDQAELAVRDVFLATKGAQLTDLKRQIDNGGDHRDLDELLWVDIDSAQIRGQILDHFKEEATPTGQVKVLSDIDDTFYVNYKDASYPSKTVYPGLVSLYSELDKGPNATKPDATGDITFISARPYDRAGLIQDDITRPMLKANGMGDAAVRSGDFLHLIGNHEIADGKTANLAKERQMYPEYTRVLFGDSGQGDMYFEADAIKSGGADTSAAFLHNVTHMSDQERQGYKSQGIFVYDTYVGAAAEAFRRGLISKEGLQRVATQAMTDFANVQFPDSDDGRAQKAARLAELKVDVAAVQTLLG